MRRPAALLALAVAVAACGGQAAPSRGTLPDLSIEATECSVPVGEGRGAFLVSVLPDVAAADVLQPGDVIVELAGRPVVNVEELIAAVQQGAPGDEVDIRLTRAEEEVTVTTSLDESPDQPGRPILGVNARTDYATRPFVEVDSAELADSPLVRLVGIDGGLAALDPVEHRWQRLDMEEPENQWISLGGRVVSLGETGEGEPALSVDGGEPVAVTDDVPADALIIGGVGELALLAVTGGEQPEVVAVDPASGDVAWRWSPEGDLTGLIPLIAMRHPDGSSALIVLTPSLNEPATAAVLVVDTEGTAVAIPSEDLVGAFIAGWWDQRAVLAMPLSPDGIPTGEIVTIDAVGGQMTALEAASVELADTLRTWAVGDGQHVLMLVPERLVVADLLNPAEVQPLTQGCELQVADPGWAP
jgi:PDZ domain